MQKRVNKSLEQKKIEQEDNTTSFTILGDGGNNAIAPKNLLDILKEVQIALREIDNENNIDLESIQNIKDISIDEEKLCEYLWYVFFDGIRKEENAKKKYYVYGFCMKQKQIKKLNEKNANNVKVDKRLTQTNKINPSIPHELDKRGLKHIEHIASCFRAIYNKNIDYKNILPKSLQPNGVKLELALYKIMKKILQNVKNNSYYSHRSDRGRINSFFGGDDDYIDTFRKYFAYLFKNFTNEIQTRYNIDSIALFVKIFMLDEFLQNAMKKKMREDGLTMAKLTLRIIEQNMQEGKNLKEVLKELFPPLSDESKMQKVCNFIYNDTKLHLLNKDALMEYKFIIDSECENEIIASLNSIFEQSYNISQEFNNVFEKFEDILMKNNDYASYGEKEKEVINRLKFIYTTMSDALLSVGSMLNTKDNLTPRAKTRIYKKGINDMQEAIDKIKQENKNISNTKQNNKPIGNPFLDPKLNPRIND